MSEPIKSEQVQHLEMTIRYYAALARRWETRAAAVELELFAAQERLARMGSTNYHWGAD